MNDPMVLLGRLAAVLTEIGEMSRGDSVLMRLADRAEELRLELAEAVQELERKVRENARS